MKCLHSVSRGLACNSLLHMLLYQFENKKFDCLSYRKKTLKLSNKLTCLKSEYWMSLLHMEAV